MFSVLRFDFFVSFYFLFYVLLCFFFFFFSSRRRHTRCLSDWSSDVCSSDLVVRQADAGLVWSRKFYHYIVEHWMDGDPSAAPPPAARKRGRNRGWEHMWADRKSVV